MEDSLKIEAGKLLAEMRTMLDENPTGFDSETSEKYDRIESDHDAKVRAIEARDRLAERSVEIADEEARSVALGAGEDVDLGAEKRDSVAPTATAEYRNAFERFIRNDVTDEVRAAMSKGTSSTGGYLVPEEWGNSLITSLVAQSPVLGLARSFVTSSGDKMHFPVVTFDSGTAPLNQPNLKAAAIAEAGTYAETEDTVSEIQFSAYKYGTVARASDELIRDSLFPIDNLIREQATKTLGYTIGSVVATGSGSSAPQGYNNASISTTAASSSALAADELITVQHSIGVPYRQNAQWVMSDSALSAVRRLKDSSNRYLLQWDYAAGAPQTILGKPVTVDPFLPAVATGAKHTVYGDFNAGFGIRRVAGINIRTLFEQYALNGQIGWRIDVSLDSRLLDPAALAVYKQA
jgi:HK97 family phage major capsid protein